MNSNHLSYFLLIILFFIGCKNEPRVDETTIMEVNNILEKNIELQLGRFKQISRNNMDDINEPVKHKYRLLIMAAESTMTTYEEFIGSYEKRVDSLKSFFLKSSDLNYRKDFFRKSFKDLNRIDELTINTFDSLLRKDYKIFGFRHEGMEMHLKGFQNEYNDLQNKLMPKLSSDVSRDDVLGMKLNFIKYAAVHKAHFFIEKFRELAGGKVYCQPHWIFPLIQTKRNLVKKGDYFEAQIHVGNGYEFHPLDEPKIIVNGDTLEFNKGEEFATYKFITTRRGEKKLNLEFLMINRLTGEKYNIFSEYVVEVN